MNLFDFISLFGGLALFLYGMRLMGDGLQQGSSGALKRFMEKVANNPLTGFLLGLLVTAVIQSSTATIVLTSGLVGAGILTLRPSASSLEPMSEQQLPDRLSGFWTLTAMLLRG